MVSGGQSLMTFSWWPPDAEQDAPLEGGSAGCPPRDPASGVARVAVGDDLDADEQAEAADLADVRVVGERRPQPLEQPRAERRRAFGEALVAEDADGGAVRRRG